MAHRCCQQRALWRKVKAGAHMSEDEECRSQNLLVPAKAPNSMDIKFGERHATIQGLLWCPANGVIPEIEIVRLNSFKNA